MTDALRAALRARVRGLYAITPEGLERADLLARCAAALAGGARLLQLRSKGESADERRARAQALRALCIAHDALFIVNDDLELARAVGADGVHLGRDDAHLADARAAWPAGLLGASCYDSLARARTAAAAGADYLAFGSVFASTVKPGAVRAPLELFAQAHGLGLPLVAIGGIARGNCTQLRAAGADACAVITDLFGDAGTRPDEVRARAAALCALLDPAAR